MNVAGVIRNRWFNRVFLRCDLPMDTADCDPVGARSSRM